ncbi:MAG: SMI1/KNR4 family protein [Kofleriaceae bacterium]
MDPNWKVRGAWPEGEHGSILHLPATEAEIAEAERRMGHAFPPSYRAFLALHRGWQNC